jgi:hypothetical protein
MTLFQRQLHEQEERLAQDVRKKTDEMQEQTVKHNEEMRKRDVC